MSEQTGTSERHPVAELHGFRANFLLGRIVATAEVVSLLGRIPYDLVARHAVNDHGSLTRKERKMNLESMAGARLRPTGGPIISRYLSNPQHASSPWVVIKTSDGWAETLIDLE